MNLLRILYIALGFVFFGLAAVGSFLPVLPTVPFLLLASFFFSKGSKRFERWFTSTKLYHNHLESFLRNRSMTRKTKTYLLALATTMMIFGMIVVPLPAIRIFLGVAIAFMYYYFAFHIKTITPEEEIIIINEEKALQASSIPAEAISLRETAYEPKAMHEEAHEKVLEEAVEGKDKSSTSAIIP